MKKIIRQAILPILAGLLLSSCDLMYSYYITFWNESSYKITVKCNVIDPSSFTLEPDTSQFTKAKVKSMSEINISYNDNAFVSISVSDDLYAANVYFKDK
jgi:hypothetical protein